MDERLIDDALTLAYSTLTLLYHRGYIDYGSRGQITNTLKPSDVMETIVAVERALDARKTALKQEVIR